MATDNRAYGTLMRPPLAYKPEPGQQIVAYVRSGGPRDGDTQYIYGAPLYNSLNDALILARPGLGDVVVVMPGHEEEVSTADAMDNLAAGTQIIGLGSGSSRPKFTWTATAATWLLDQAGVTIDNCVLLMAGDPDSTTALTVTAPMTVSAEGCALRNCRIQSAVDADQRATIAITTTAAADDFEITNCDVHGDGDGTGVTTILRMVGADRLRMRGTTVDGATSSTTVGVMQFLTTASTKVKAEDCLFVNRVALSVHAVTGMAGTTGFFKDCGFGILDNATLAGLAGTHGFQMFGCKTANLAGENGADSTPVSI